MTAGDFYPDPPNTATPGDIAVVHCTEAFIFTPGNRLRAAHCLLCAELIGGEPATLIGAAALAGDACLCGGVVSDVFLLHAAHMPVDAPALQAAIHRGLHCHHQI
jgi:hypothetical protein